MWQVWQVRRGISQLGASQFGASEFGSAAGGELAGAPGHYPNLSFSSAFSTALYSQPIK